MQNNTLKKLSSWIIQIRRDWNMHFSLKLLHLMLKYFFISSLYEKVIINLDADSII